MEKTVPGLLLLLALTARAATAQVETALPAPGSASGSPAASAGASWNSAPTPIALAGFSLASPAPGAPSASAAAPLARPQPRASAAAASAPLAPALAEPAGLPDSAVPNADGSARRAERDDAARAAAGTAPGDEREEVSAPDPGRALFDAADPAASGKRGLWATLLGWVGHGDLVPAWPGARGEKVRLGGRTYVLEQPLPDEGGARMWQMERDFVVKILPPPRAGDPARVDEAGLLRALRRSEVPHAALIAASADGRVLVKERLIGATAVELLERGYKREHAEGWAELGAKLIHAGVTADLSPGNLTWQHWRTRWALADASGVKKARPQRVLERLLSPAARRAGVDAGTFLAEVRGRLGPSSLEWAGALAALRSSPVFARDLDALDAHDRALPPPPEVVFGPAAGRSPYPDKVARARDVTKALGYDPLTARPSRALHADDPGKQNTVVFSVEPAGKAPVVVKIAELIIVRRELAVRRVIRRWFGRYFDAPSAFGVEAGRSSYLVMEFSSGGGSYAQNPLTIEQRAALAVLVNALGLSDMNPGNVLFNGPPGKPALIDFELAFNRQRPVAGRLPDESIALEMPWVSRFERNHAEDYQPAIRAWRALLARPGSEDALRIDFRAAGFSILESEQMLAIVKANTADLDWTIQNDVDFVNQFVARNGGQ